MLESGFTLRNEDDMQFYLREGTALSEADNAKVVVGERAASGWLSTTRDCDRCGGQGGANAWKFTGWTCYKCDGRCRLPCRVRVYTLDRLTELDTAKAKREAEKAAVLKAEKDAEICEFQAWAEQHETTLAGIRSGHNNPFLSDLKRQLDNHRKLTDKQLRAAINSLGRIKDVERMNASSTFVGEIKERISFEAIVVGVYETEGQFGHIDIVKMRDEDGNLFTWFASGYTDLERSNRIAITGTVKKHETYRDINQTIITRCKYDKFEVVDPDDAAKLEDVA